MFWASAGVAKGDNRLTCYWQFVDATLISSSKVRRPSPHLRILESWPRVPRTGGKRHNTARASLAVMGNGGKSLAARGTYSLPEELARHASRKWFASDQLRGACREAGEGRSEEHTSELQSRQY